ncbi:MAG: hypothetical protein NVS4B7_03960 [Ktedonobacteraceae bacterium]
MPAQKLGTDYDPLIQISDFAMLERLGETVLLGNWFVFLAADWLQRSGMAQLLASSSVEETKAQSTIAFRGKEVTLPGARIAATPLPAVNLVALTCDKALYRAHHDTVRLLIAAPQHGQAELTLVLRLSGNTYADYPVTLDEYGLCLWSMQDLPEGEYEASLAGVEGDGCHFEVAEYRLAPLNAELLEQQLSGETLRYVLSVTAFGQPYSGMLEVELQERGQRIGKREQLTCNREGKCRGAVKLAGEGPYTLSIFAGERTATLALKGTEQERRQTTVISELGEVRVLSLLPLPQANLCRGMYIARGAANTEPLLVRRLIGNEVEITPRGAIELLRVVVVDPIHKTFEEKLYSNLKASVRQTIPAPYGIVLLGAFVGGKAWEGWCAVLRPPELQLQCAAPEAAKPGARITVTLTTNIADRVVPVQLIVKDQRLIAASDTQVEFAANIKRNLVQWGEQSGTGEVERQLVHLNHNRWHVERARGFGGGLRPMLAFSASVPAEGLATPALSMPEGQLSAAFTAVTGAMLANGSANSAGQIQNVTAPSLTAMLTRLRVQFAEVVYNNIVKVQGQQSIEIQLGDSMTCYSIEAFALLPETMDWQRVETTLNVVQSVYGELGVPPFVFVGDPVMGRLDIGAASGGAIVEVRHDDDLLPLFFENGEPVTQGLPLPSGSVVRFPVRPGTITSMVRDARKGGIDVSERYVTEPGKLRHILRRLHLLTPGDEVTLWEEQLLAIRPLPGLERPFQFFVEGAAQYPFGCVEQTSVKLIAMYSGYITNIDNAELARNYESVIPAWHKRLKSMYLPKSGFSLYPPEDGGASQPDTYYAPLAVKHLLELSTAERTNIRQRALREILDDILSMAKDAAIYYKIEYPPEEVNTCHDAYQVLVHGSRPADKEKAVALVRSRLLERSGQTYVDASADQLSQRLYGTAVSTRTETAYAAAALLTLKERRNLPLVIAATNYLTSQMNEAGRLYSTVDTAACLALLLGLRSAGIMTTAGTSRVILNGQEMSLAHALTYEGKVESLRCVEGVVAVQMTSEVIEDWSKFQAALPVTVSLEHDGKVGRHFKVGDAVDLVIRVPRYEPGLLAHVCLPAALARIVGGGQVKRFSLDFCEQNMLRIPLAVVGSTSLPRVKDVEAEKSLLRWLKFNAQEDEAAYVENAETGQHWAVIVRNMFKEEQVASPGLLELMVE